MADKPYRGVGPAERAIKRGIVDALELVGSDLTGKAQRMAPKREGYLRASGRWELENATGFIASRGSSTTQDVAVTVTFDVPYAEEQHENTQYQHRNGEAKYLDRPLKDNALKYRKYIERAIKQQLSRKT